MAGIFSLLRVGVSEWERNKHKVLKEGMEAIKAHAKSALKLAEFVSPDEAQQINDIVTKYRDVEAEQLLLAETYFDKVNKLLYSSLVVPISDSLKIIVADRALTKQAPFHNSKNNLADALHFFSSVEYLESDSLVTKKLFFITANYREFSEPGNSEVLHHELAQECKNVDVLFYDNLARALKMNDELIEELDRYHEYMLEQWLDNAYDTWANK